MVLDVVRRQGPVSRDELVFRVHEALLPWTGWKVETTARRVREAVNNLQREGHPVCSGGHGFYLAKEKEELEEGLKKKERAAVTMLREVARARKIPIGKMWRQLSLEFGQ
jgi:hypothetical protein